MHVGILGGTGPLGRGLALRLADAGVEISLGSRDPGRADLLASEMIQRWPDHELGIVGVPNVDAAQAEIVVLATPWDAAVQTARELTGSLSGKVVVSVGNVIVKQGREMLALAPPRGSLAEALQSALPDASVAAACHHLPAGPLGDLEALLDADVLVCSDHPEATEATMAMLGVVEGLRPLDAGSLDVAGAIEAFTAVLASLNVRYRARCTLRLAGLEKLPRGGASSR
ncbi:MAG: NADPH-dependent F420 reductase [Acidimicrobiales bacterium]